MDSKINERKVKELGKFPKENIVAAIRRRLDTELSDEALFWLKVDVAEFILKDRYEPETAQLLRNKKSFWAWFNRLWETNDRRIVVILQNRGVKKIPISDYKTAQVNSFDKYELDEYLITN